MLAMRAYMRALTVDGVRDEASPPVGLSGRMIEDMYQIMAIANYEDRFVIPTGARTLRILSDACLRYPDRRSEAGRARIGSLACSGCAITVS
jgi:nitrate reductase beta subunit